MALKFKPVALFVSVALIFGVTGCGGKSDDAGKNATDKTASAPPAADTAPAASVKTANLSDGPDVCFRAIAKHLGNDVKVAEITSFFSAGSAIDSDDEESQGQMTICKVDYQSPDDPRKLVSTTMDIDTGTFSEPNPVEITVMGNAAEFKLDDYIIPLSSINAAALTSIMEAQKAKLSGVYGSYAWSGVRLSGPSAFNAKHTLRLDLTGRIASNDIKGNGYASVSTDGKTITADHLMP